MALVKCHECKNLVSTTAKTCPACGAKVVKPVGWTGKLILLSLVVSVIASFISEHDARDSQLATSNSVQPPPAQNKGSEPRLSASAKIKIGKDLLKRWNPLDPKGPLILNSDVLDAKSKLQSISPGQYEYAEAQLLLHKIDSKDRAGEELVKNAVAKAKVDDRSEFASKVERNFLEQGMSVTVSVSGKRNQTLTYQYALVTKAFVFKVANDTDFLERCKTAGFSTVIFTDGYNEIYTFDVAKNKFL